MFWPKIWVKRSGPYLPLVRQGSRLLFYDTNMFYNFIHELILPTSVLRENISSINVHQEGSDWKALAYNKSFSHVTLFCGIFLKEGGQNYPQREGSKLLARGSTFSYRKFLRGLGKLHKI